MISKTKNPFVLKGLSITISLAATYVLFRDFDGITSLTIVGAFLFYGLSLHVWLLSRTEISIIENGSILLLTNVFSKNKILISKIESCTVAWSLEPVPYCTLVYKDSDENGKKVTIALWQYDKEELQKILLYLHEVNPNISEVNLDQYFFRK